MAESEPEQKSALWECEYCLKAFIFEKAFMNHKCKERERIDELRSSIGQAAYAHYSDWMKAKKRSVPPIETFATSKLYSSFVKFAEYAVKTNIPNVKQFIKLMVEHRDVSPSLWARDNVYSMYLEWYDQGYAPEIQVIESLDFAKELCVEYECTPAELFKTVPVKALCLHITRRKLSPWFLVSSRVFRDHLAKANQQDKDKIEQAVKMGAMVARIQSDPGLFKLFNRVTLAEGF